MQYTHKIDLSELNQEQKIRLLESFGYKQKFNLINDPNIHALLVNTNMKDEVININNYYCYILRDFSEDNSYEYDKEITSETIKHYIKYLILFETNLEDFLNKDIKYES